MATNNRVGTKGSQALAIDNKVNFFSKPGPFIGVVKNNVDPTRSGRLQVFVLGQGGVEDEPTHWVTVRYASPFFGMTNPVDGKDNSWTKVNHTYGMWFTPPDLNNQVLITFANGDANQGYWFACINPTLSHHMVPGLAGAVTSKPNLSSDLQGVLPKGYYPTAEFNEFNDDNQANWDTFYNIPKPVHEDQVRVLLNQGLEDDSVRGVISSSSQRESPSGVFGISTPGRVNERADDTSVRSRAGGHTFVMDDGDVNGNDQLVRLRSAGGHQILMNDAEEVIYIGHANGSSWVEFGSDGKISMFCDGDFSVRSKNNINLHSDKDINMFAANDIKMFAGKIIKQQSTDFTIKATTELRAYGGKIGIVAGTTLDLNAGSTGSWGANTELVFGASMIYLNDKAPNTVNKPADIPVKSFPETSKNGKKWQANKNMSTIGTTLPTHEPWPEHFTTTASATNLVTSTGAPVLSPNYGAKNATGAGVSKPAPKTLMQDAPASTTTIGSMTSEEVTALKAQIGYSESSNNYAAENTIGFIGKYQFGYLALIDRGYIKSTCKSNSGMNDPANWTGKDGITSKDAFLSNPEVQESIMEAQLAANYKQLKSKGVINDSTEASQTAGTLAVAHLLGAGGAASWSRGNGGADAYGMTGDKYYNRGRYAVEVLAKAKTTSTATV